MEVNINNFTLGSQTVQKHNSKRTLSAKHNIKTA